MSQRPGQRHSDEPHIAEEHLDRLLAREIARRIEAPDMTHAIMGRLGYMRLSAVARRRRVRARWTRRVATAACLSLALGAGLLMHRQSADSRRPMGPTIPAALHESLQFGGEQIDRAIESIRLFEFFPLQEDVSPQPEFIRQHRPELQRGNQPPFRWVSRGEPLNPLV